MFFTLEMRGAGLVRRFVSMTQGTPVRAMDEAQLTAAQMDEFQRGLAEWAHAGVWVNPDDAMETTIDVICAEIYRFKEAKDREGKPLAMVVIDYLQLIEIDRDAENTEKGLSKITRRLKMVAKKLNIIIVVLSQLNRKCEERANKRPLPSDLRDCLAGDALVTNAQTGERVPVRNIVERDLRFDVWALDERMQLVPRPITDAWCVGTRPVFRVTTRSGRVVECTGGHRFLTADGWRTLDELGEGRFIATPRRYPKHVGASSRMTDDAALLLGWLVGDGHLGGTPTLTVSDEEDAVRAVALGRGFGLAPQVKPEARGARAFRVILTTGRMSGAGKNPLTTWLRSLGVWELTGARKRVPGALFEEPDTVVAAFLRGLFHADGTAVARGSGTGSTVKLATISEGIARASRHSWRTSAFSERSTSARS